MGHYAPTPTYFNRPHKSLRSKHLGRLEFCLLFGMHSAIVTSPPMWGWMKTIHQLDETKMTTKLQAAYLALIADGKTHCIQGINHRHYKTLQILAAKYNVKWSLCGDTWLSLGEVDRTVKAEYRYFVPAFKMSWDSGLPQFNAAPAPAMTPETTRLNHLLNEVAGIRNELVHKRTMTDTDWFRFDLLDSFVDEQDDFLTDLTGNNSLDRHLVSIGLTFK